MQGEGIDKQRDEKIKAEIRKMVQLTPNSIPVYFIINEQDQSKLPPLPDNVPIILMNRDLTVNQMVDKLKQKIKGYPHVYIFGKDHKRNENKPEMSLKEKRKQKGTNSQVHYQGQKVVFLDKEHLQTKIGDAYDRYKNPDDMLVVVLCREELPIEKKEAPKIKEMFLAGFGLIFLAIFLVFALTQEKQEVQGLANIETGQL